MNTRYQWAQAYLKEVDRLWSEAEFESGYNILLAVLAEEPGYGRAHAYVAWYNQTQLQNANKAKRHYELALTFDPGWGYTYGQYAELLIARNDVNRLGSLLKEGIKHADVDKADLYNCYARVLEQAGRYAEADKNYKEAMRYTMNYFVMSTIKANRKRVRSKYRLFTAWYSALV